MGNDLDCRIVFLVGQKLLGCEALMHLAMALPGQDLLPGQLGNILRQELVRDQQNRIGGKALDDAHRIGRGAADVALRLHIGGGVDIGDDRNARMGFAQQANISPGD